MGPWTLSQRLGLLCAFIPLYLLGSVPSGHGCDEDGEDRVTLFTNSILSSPDFCNGSPARAGHCTRAVRPRAPVTAASVPPARGGSGSSRAGSQGGGGPRCPARQRAPRSPARAGQGRGRTASLGRPRGCNGASSSGTCRLPETFSSLNWLPSVSSPTFGKEGGARQILPPFARK